MHFQFGYIYMFCCLCMRSHTIFIWVCQYYCLDNPMDRGAWWATVLGSQRSRRDWVTSRACTPAFLFCFFLTSGQYVSSMPPTFFLSILKQLPETHVTDKDICSVLQCYVGFCHTTRWISHKYTYTPSLSLAPFPPHLIPLGLHRVPGWAPTSYLFYTW